MGVIVFNGVKSTDFGIEVETAPDYQAAKRSYTTIEVPGRNGSLHVDEGSFKNVERTYKVSFLARRNDYNHSFQAASTAIGAWLGSVPGYAQLEDSYEPDYYRIARFVEALKIDNIYDQAGKFDLKFDCKPQRFLKSGSNSITITSGTKLYNPTLFEAKPYIEITGSGDVQITITSISNTRSVSIAMGNDYTSAVIDCENQEVYSGNTNIGSKTTISLDGFPVLGKGENTITSTNISSIRLTPNWWTL